MFRIMQLWNSSLILEFSDNLLCILIWSISLLNTSFFGIFVLTTDIPMYCFQRFCAQVVQLHRNFFLFRWVLKFVFNVKKVHNNCICWDWFYNPFFIDGIVALFTTMIYCYKLSYFLGISSPFLLIIFLMDSKYIQKLLLNLFSPCFSGQINGLRLN